MWGDSSVDEKGPHIYRIENPAMKNCFDAIGYHAIGSGEIHAVSTFIVNNYEVKKTSLQRGLALAFEAKKRSERAVGVGEQTDLYIVTKDNTTHLPDDAIKELTEIYRKRIDEEKKVLSEVEDMIGKLDVAKYLK